MAKSKVQKTPSNKKSPTSTPSSKVIKKRPVKKNLRQSELTHSPLPSTQRCFTFEAVTMEQDNTRRPKPGRPKRWYVHELLPHLQGVRHPQDRQHDTDPDLEKYNPFALAFRKVVKSKYKPLADISAWQQLFDAAMDGNLKNFESALHAMGSPLKPTPIQPAACLAAGYSRHKVLRYCLENGAEFDSHLTSAASMGATTREMWKVMVDHNWKKVKTDTGQARDEVLRRKETDPDWVWQYLKELCWVYDYSNPKNYKERDRGGNFTAAYYEKHLPCMAWK